MSPLVKSAFSLVIAAFLNLSPSAAAQAPSTDQSSIGVRIRAEIVEDGERRSVYQWVNSGGSFGGNSLRRHIGVGAAEKIEVLEVYWPRTGRTQRFQDVAVDQMIIVTEGRDEYQTLAYGP